MNKTYYTIGNYYKFQIHGTRDTDIILHNDFFRLSPKKQRKMMKRIRQDHRKFREFEQKACAQQIQMKKEVEEWSKVVPVEKYNIAVPLAIVPLNASSKALPHTELQDLRDGKVIWKREPTALHNGKPILYWMKNSDGTMQPVTA